MACEDEEASARVRVWRRRRRGGGEWCEEGVPRGVLESGSAVVSGRVAIFSLGCLASLFLCFGGGVPEATRTRTRESDRARAERLQPHSISFVLSGSQGLFDVGQTPWIRPNPRVEGSHWLLLFFKIEIAIILSR
jgi:hypothetical protein